MSDKKIPLVEMFGPTIQGEGAVIGQQTYFLRFGLCDYSCKMCDSMNAVDPKQVKANAEWLTQDEIAHKFYDFHVHGSTRWVTLSGGNPCIHDLSTLLLELRSHDYKVVVETQGTKAPEWLKECSVITVSPKGPGMGENCDLNVLDAFMEKCVSFMSRVCMKIVVFDQRDLEFASMMYERYGDYGIPFYLSLGNPYPPGIEIGKPDMPSFNDMVHKAELLGRYKMLFDDIKNDPILSKMRFLPQWHVFVWGNQKGK